VGAALAATTTIAAKAAPSNVKNIMTNYLVDACQDNLRRPIKVIAS